MKRKVVGTTKIGMLSNLRMIRRELERRLLLKGPGVLLCSYCNASLGSDDHVFEEISHDKYCIISIVDTLEKQIMRSVK